MAKNNDKYDTINKSNEAVLTAQEGRFEMSCTLDTYVCIHIYKSRCTQI